MRRRLWLVALLSSALLSGLLPAAASATDPPPLPSSIAAVGDSITRAASSGGSLGADYPQNSWSTGTNATVNSHYLRLLAWNAAISGRNHNLSVSGAKMVDLNGQMQQVVALDPDPGYLTVLIGGNDICTDTAPQMTSVSDFRAQFTTAMTTLTAGSPTTNVYVVSIPNVYHLWELFKDNFWARFIWSVGDVCQSLLANPLSTATDDVGRRASVAQRNVEFNIALQEVCATFARCRYDGNAVYNTVFTTSDAAGDYFHPSISGQAKLALVSWNAGYWAAGPPPPPNQAPVASFTYGCTYLVCSFDAIGSTDADGTISGYAWSFGDGSGTGLTTSHTFSAAGTYVVALTVTDDDAATGSQTQSVTVTAEPPAGTVSIAGLAGSAGTRKGGWTATMTVTVQDNVATRVSGATVTGTWTTGATGGCTTTTNGTCSFTLNVGRKIGSVTWTVANISHATLTYNSAGDTIKQVTILRP
ncbi:MAG: PKD domain-containing protein [Candidatus Limnocylindria bacterium]